MRSNAMHEELMLAVLRNIADTPLVLKGGTALLLAYGLDRFSEDLDFDAPHKLNLSSRIRSHLPAGIVLTDFDTQKDTATVTRFRLRYQSPYGTRLLKIEISYRTPAPIQDVRYFNGFRVASLPRIIGQKLKAAHDGDTPRSKIRDAYDLDFLMRRWPSAFTQDLLTRLRSFTSDPEALISRYRPDFEEDDLIPDLVELDHLALRMNYMAEELNSSYPEMRRRLNQFSRPHQVAGEESIAAFSELVKKALVSLNIERHTLQEADWRLIEDTIIKESTNASDRPMDEVVAMLCALSPGAATLTRQHEIRAIAQHVPGDPQSPDSAQFERGR